METANYLCKRGHSVGVLTTLVEPNCLDNRVIHHAVPSGDWHTVAIRSYAIQSDRIHSTISRNYDAHGAFSAASPHDGVYWIGSVHREWIEIGRKTRGFMGRLKQALNPFHSVVLNLEQQMLGHRKYRKLIALTTTLAEELRKHYQVPTRDIEILPNGVNCEEFHVADEKSRTAARQHFQIPEDAKVILFVANEAQRKGFEPLLRAMAQIQRPDLHLLAAGRLGGSKKWEKLLRSLNLTDRVTFAGSLSNVSSAFAAADVFALPTIYEAWGLVIVEALASGLPVLTSRLAGAAEAVHEGETGLLLDEPHCVEEIREKLNILLREPFASPPQIAASIARYHWPTILKQYEQILSDAYSSAH